MMSDGEEMSEVERQLFQELGWFAPDREVLGNDCRPLSLGSELAIRVMGLGLLEPVEATADPVEVAAALKLEEAEIGVYVWLHSAPVPEVEAALWDGSWRLILEGLVAQEEPVEPKVIAQFRSIRERLLACVRASRYRVLPRPKPKEDKTPDAVRGPGIFAWRLALLAKWTGWDRQTLKWELPLSEALQLLHAAEWGEGNWTVPLTGPAGRRATKADFSDFDLGVDDPEAD